MFSLAPPSGFRLRRNSRAACAVRSSGHRVRLPNSSTIQPWAVASATLAIGTKSRQPAMGHPGTSRPVGPCLLQPRKRITRIYEYTRYDSAGRTLTATDCFGPQRVSTTLAVESVPISTIEDAASMKNWPAVASCDDSHQPPTAMKISRAVCDSTGPSTFAAPCDEKYIDSDSPMKAYIGAAVARYCRLVARTPASLVKMLTQRSGKIAASVPTAPMETNVTAPATHATRRARAIFCAPIAMPTIGTEAMPTANAIDVSRNSSRAPMP